jgi:hypothetical protein
MAKDFAAGRPLRFARISMLTGAPFVPLTARFLQPFADRGEIMRIYSDASAFDAALIQATKAR